jgi:hypothetical protein
MRKVAGRLKLELSQYRDLEAFAQFGSDLDADTQRTLARGARLVKTLNQGERQPLAVGEQVAQIFAATNGYTDRVDLDRVEEFHRSLVARMRAESQDLLGRSAAATGPTRRRAPCRPRWPSSPTTSATTSTRRARPSRAARTPTGSPAATAARTARRRRGRGDGDGAGDRTPVGAGAGAASGSVRADDVS